MNSNQGFFAKYFDFQKNNTNYSREISAGLTTFMTMAYILAVNPDILSQAGMDKGAVFVATALSAALGTFIMAFYAKLPFALAPGMGLNAFFTYTVCLGLGKPWQFALTAVFLEGLIFIILSIFKVREAIVKSIPNAIKNAISVGIGLFIALVGMANIGLLTSEAGTIIGMKPLNSPEILISLFGIIFISILLILKVKGALLIGIFSLTLIGIPFSLTQYQGLVALPPSISSTFLQFQWSDIFTSEMAFIVITFLLVDIFDTVGTLVGVTTKANMRDKNGNVPNIDKALLSDAIATTVGAALGTSTVTTFVESASGVAEGGRTGMTSFTTGCMFLLALIFSPIFLAIPPVATAPALIIVGAFMMSPIKNIDLEDYSESIPAFLTVIAMPFAYSISEGIFFGVVSYIFIKLFSGKAKDIPSITYVVGVILIIAKIFQLLY